MIIGRQGDSAQKLRKDLFKFMRKNKIQVAEEVKIDIQEVQNPDSDAAIVAYGIVEALEKRMPFRRAMKMTKDKVMAVRGVKGVRIVVTGRLNGAEMARREEVKDGSIPLQTFRADVDYAMERANLPYGVLGVKVWINKGEVFEDKK
jgi:small subunit ribosomal protein S3